MYATGGSRRESYRPGLARWPTGEYQEPPPARDAGSRIPSARPGKYAASGPGNRYTGTGQQRPTTQVTVKALGHDAGWEPTSWALVCSFAAVVLAVAIAWMGGELVERLGVGVDEGAGVDAPSSLSHRHAAA
jgi:hypothetical protein